MAKSEKNSTKEEKTLTKEELKEQKKQEKLKNKKLKKEKKEKKGGLFKKLKEAWSELKKVTWPGFSTVVKKTGVVILVVLIFTVVLFGIEYLLGLLYNVFMSKFGG
ncbi:MAG: preprotein translocase subunit SecE [Clostridia bacterium]|nr:preprotein translocase subunit SecE [Clostridia bacterium]